MNRFDRNAPIIIKQARILANRAIKYLNWNGNESILVEKIMYRNAYRHYKWAYDKLEQGTFKEKEVIALWLLKPMSEKF